ncbi:uncharacterized protein [Spinacia oleracea]|uniref:ATP-dependent DNA helicase n=1 Tax=Spinacia oleracea TaxID=3562 RepID=A0ABM3QQE1_SPIOL|nr:uncharacterized protein LOC110779605 [Spinacia oleracea]
MAMQYPLLFPYGEDGYTTDIPHNDRKETERRVRTKVTVREYNAFRFQQREKEAKTRFQLGRLNQQQQVDAFTCMQEGRLEWVRSNQKKLRKDVLRGLTDAVSRGDTTPASVGQRVILPSSFTGSPRFMIQNYHDALAICRWAGPPDLFITMTCNPKWPEIREFLSLIPGQKPEDRPDIIARVFKIKLDELMVDLTKRNICGRTKVGFSRFNYMVPVGYQSSQEIIILTLNYLAILTFNHLAAIYTIEFQKRGLPHVHILLFLHEADKLRTPSDIDRLISAELPDQELDPIAFEAVVQYMTHGPCGNLNPKCPCMHGGRCTKYYPKDFNNETVIGEDGYPAYMRRNNGRTTTKNGHTIDNTFIVPYNVDLLVKYQAHINVEVCNKYTCTKYLFKYMNKGPDMALATIQEATENAMPGGQLGNHEPQKDEIQSYLQCRYVSAADACWRVFGFPIQYKYPPVQRLNCHLKEEQTVMFEDHEHLDEVLERVGPAKTPLIGWMEANKKYPQARTLTYHEFPTEWVWLTKEKRWKVRDDRFKIGRIYYVHPASGELYYLRMLLDIVTGSTTFGEIRTVNGIEYATFKEACNAMGLLEGDTEWHEALQAASSWAHAPQLRELFVTILIFCEVSNPSDLWYKNWELLSDDVLYRQRKRFNSPNIMLTTNQVQNYALYDIELILNRNNRSRANYGNMPFPDMALVQQTTNRLVLEEKMYDVGTLADEASTLEVGLNPEQSTIYHKILEAVENRAGGVFFIYGSGGTGKTYLWSTLISRLRSEGRIVIAVASSGIAALLLHCGRTAHSRFSIPIHLNENSCCRIMQGSDLAFLLQQASLIIWDEAPMVHRHAFEAVDRTLRDIMQTNDKPFGGKTVVLGGDFRQILPVVPRKGRAEIVDASVNRSPTIWPHFTVFKLTTNMRLRGSSDIVGLEEMQNFSKWVLDVGDGQIHATAKTREDEANWIQIPPDLLIKDHPDKKAALVEEIYPDLLHRYTDIKYLAERAILAPKNDCVDDINNYILSMIHGEEGVYKSVDRVSPLANRTSVDEDLYPT